MDETSGRRQESVDIPSVKVMEQKTREGTAGQRAGEVTPQARERKRKAEAAATASSGEQLLMIVSCGDGQHARD